MSSVKVESGEKRKGSSKRKKDGKDKESSSKTKDKKSSSSKSSTKSSAKIKKEEPVEVLEEPQDFDDCYDGGEYLDDDTAYLDDNYDGEEDGGLADSGLKEKTWKFLSNAQFVEDLLQTVLQEIGPYVPFAADVDADDIEVASWKCLNILRALNWNLGKVEQVLDNPEALYEKAGILEVPKKAKVRRQITCSVCEEEVKWSKSSALECQHRFCNDCWNGAISASSTFQQLFGNLNCMNRGCKLTILGCLVKKVVSDKDWQQYLRMLVNSASYSQCPNISCGKIAKANYRAKTVSKVVQCECGDSYCFNCGMAPHIPASCRDVEKWRAKDSDDEASINLIKATTTACPKCGRALDRVTACNHITCGCGHQFCFVCKSDWGKCSVYSCSKFKTVEEHELSTKQEFAPGYKTSSAWLVQHERFVAFSKKFVNAKNMHDKVLNMKSLLLEKSLNYREAKPGGNPQFIIDGWEILLKSWNILQYTFVWGFWNIPPKICAQKNIYEWQLKNYEKLLADLLSALSLPATDLDHLKTKHLYTLIESNLIKKIEDAEDLLSLFSEKAIGKIESQSVLARWSCPGCNYSNHPVEQEKTCGHCGQPRPEVKIVWFPE